MSESIVLFDIPSKDPCSSWSLNPWKTRLLFNYKGLDYTTEWIEYPDIRPKFEPHVPPNTRGHLYTIPTIKLPGSGGYVMDSRSIADEIEKIHPEPSVHLDSPYVDRLMSNMRIIVPELYPVFVTKVPKRLLNDPSAEYFTRTRSEDVGAPLDEFGKQTSDDDCFKTAEPAIREVTAMLKENTDGPFFMGSTFSWADIVWIGLLLFFQRIGDDVFESLLSVSGDREVHLGLLRAAEPWTKRGD